MCKAKRVGGLRMKELRFNNLALLIKWRWGILLDLLSLWVEITKVRYGS